MVVVQHADAVLLVVWRSGYRHRYSRCGPRPIPRDKGIFARALPFEHHGTGQTDDGKFVGYLSVANPNPLVDSPYRILVSETFVDNPPAVDIYVTANVTESNTGIKLTSACHHLLK